MLDDDSFASEPSLAFTDEPTAQEDALLAATRSLGSQASSRRSSFAAEPFGGRTTTASLPPPKVKRRAPPPAVKLRVLVGSPSWSAGSSAWVKNEAPGVPSGFTNGVGYKMVAKIEDRYFSYYGNGRLEYELGVRVTDQAKTRLRGGLYCCRSPRSAMRQSLPNTMEVLRTAPKALLKCYCEGPYVEYEGGKIACSRITPVAELPLPTKAYTRKSFLSYWDPEEEEDPLPMMQSTSYISSTGDQESLYDSTSVDDSELSRFDAREGAMSPSGSSKTRAEVDDARAGYKLVAKVKGRYFSLYAGESLEYVFGEEVEEEAKPGRNGGFFCCESPRTARKQFVPPLSLNFAGAIAEAKSTRKPQRDSEEMELAPPEISHKPVKVLLKCQMRGPFVEYPGGKIACSKLTPLEEVPLPPIKRHWLRTSMSTWTESSFSSLRAPPARLHATLDLRAQTAP